MPKEYIPTRDQLLMAIMGHPLAEQAYAEGLFHGVKVQHLNAFGKLTTFSLQSLRRAKAMHLEATIWASGAVMCGARVYISPDQRKVDAVLAKSCMSVRLAAQGAPAPVAKAALANPNFMPNAKALAKALKSVNKAGKQAKLVKQYERSYTEREKERGALCETVA